MDVFYYSNYCQHSSKTLSFLVKHDIVKSLVCICVDKRKVNPHNGQVQVILENGTSVLLPPNVHSVPSLMLTKENFTVIVGFASVSNHFKKQITETDHNATNGNGEPMSFTLGRKDVVSEGFTMYAATPTELSTKGSGQSRNMHHYVQADGYTSSIPTPPDTYKPNKISNDVTVDSIEQMRTDDISSTLEFTNKTPFLPDSRTTTAMI